MNTQHIDPRIQAICKKLRELRVKKGYTSHVKFAEDYNLPKMQYWRMEKGINFTMESLLKVLDVHKITLKDFFEKKYKEPDE